MLDTTEVILHWSIDRYSTPDDTWIEFVKLCVKHPAKLSSLRISQAHLWVSGRSEHSNQLTSFERLLLGIELIRRCTTTADVKREGDGESSKTFLPPGNFVVVRLVNFFDMHRWVTSVCTIILRRMASISPIENSALGLDPSNHKRIHECFEVSCEVAADRTFLALQVPTPRIYSTLRSRGNGGSKFKEEKQRPRPSNMSAVCHLCHRNQAPLVFVSWLEVAREDSSECHA